MPIQFGVFDHVDRSHVSMPERYADRLRAMERYDEHGSSSMYVAPTFDEALGVSQTV